MAACTHLETLGTADPPALTTQGCQECLATGSQCVHLRRCLSCGHIGCCDSSPNKHASVHFQQTRDPVITSYEPGESWRWCFVDEVGA